MVERRPPQSTEQSGREDTVAIPVTRQESSNGSGHGAAKGNGRVLPPMPKDPPPGANGRSATPPPPPSSKPTRKPVTKPVTKPSDKPASPPVQAPVAKAASAKAAPATPAAGTPVAKPAAAAPAPAPAPEKRPAVTPMPVVPEVDKRAERQAERDAKAAERARLREEQRVAKEAQDAEAAARKAADSKDGPRSRRARLRMTRIDPWSVMKTAFLLSIALGVVIVISVFMVWSVLDAADVWASINQTVRDITGETATPFDIEDYLGTRRVVGFAMIVAAVDVVLLTAIATLGAFLYNMSASLLGGIEVTLAEDK
jgi:hypothetical protein